MAGYENIDLVGVLASEEDMYKYGNGKQPVFVNNNDTIQFNVKLVSKTPDGFQNVKLFTGFKTNIVNSFINEDIKLTDAEREELFEREISQYYIIFNYQFRNDYYSIKSAYLKRKVMTYTDEKQYIGVPIYQADSEIKSVDEFANKVLTGKYLGQVKNFDTEIGNTPQFILFNDSDSETHAIGLLKNHRYAFGGYSFICDKLKKVQFKEEWLDYVFSSPNNDTVKHIDVEIYNHNWVCT